MHPESTPKELHIAEDLRKYAVALEHCKTPVFVHLDWAWGAWTIVFDDDRVFFCGGA